MYRLKRFALPFFEINIRQKNAEQQIERNKASKCEGNRMIERERKRGRNGQKICKHSKTQFKHDKNMCSTGINCSEQNSKKEIRHSAHIITDLVLVATVLHTS